MSTVKARSLAEQINDEDRLEMRMAFILVIKIEQSSNSLGDDTNFSSLASAYAQAMGLFTKRIASAARPTANYPPTESLCTYLDRLSDEDEDYAPDDNVTMPSSDLMDKLRLISPDQFSDIDAQFDAGWSREEVFEYLLNQDQLPPEPDSALTRQVQGG